MLSTDELIERLGYTESKTFLRKRDFQRVPALSHLLRLAAEDCGLVGVYALRKYWDKGNQSTVPVVYVCEAENKDKADRIHRLVWNQNVVPFVIVRTRAEVRLYSGFSYRDDASPSGSRSATTVLRQSVSAVDLASRVIPSFCAESIDNGIIWECEGQYVRPEGRVDWHLLENLQKLGTVLRENMDLPARSAHALIGKYLYLRYLRDRRILSDAKLSEFRVSKNQIFSRNATLSAVRKLIKRLDKWLNGSVFDIPWSQGIRPEHVREVAGAFFGDDPETGQLNLLEDYDFAHIPVETLSVVYEQFLHAEGKGKRAGAYYTPIPLIDFVLDSMEELRPLEPGMRVLDPACGSGAFLVQAYRRLVEKQLALKDDGKLRPTELRDLLRSHFFGVDRDEDACQVTELSLVLTLLDYITPPDLSNTKFQLPVLRGHNIFAGEKEDFFNTESDFHSAARSKPFDWIVGNPPWTEIATTRDENGEVKFEPEFKYAYPWMQSHASEFPTGGNQVAELFCWKVTQHIDEENGVVGLLVPAMTLFKKESTRFRREFFRRSRVESVVNLANLAYVLFAGRAQKPCAALFFRNRTGQKEITPEENIITYAPFIINQEPNRPRRGHEKTDTWSVTVNGSEIHEVSVVDALRGDALTWKLAMWGSYRDRRLLYSVADEFRSLLEEMGLRGLSALAGAELRSAEHDGVEFAQDLVGKMRFRTSRVPSGGCFRIPTDALTPIGEDEAYLRKRGGRLPLKVCKPPHVIVNGSRNYAIYSDQFIFIPPRQIGIAGPREQAGFLKALSLYLMSDFALYHQFFLSPQWGIDTNLANLDTLRMLPIPFGNDRQDVIDELVHLHTALVESERKGGARKAASARSRRSAEEPSLFDAESTESSRDELLKQMNEVIYRCLGLDDEERILVEDLVHVRLSTNKGKVGKDAIRIPENAELKSYAKALVDELDGFFEGASDKRHLIAIFADHESRSGLIEITCQQKSKKALPPRIVTASEGMSGAMRDIRARIRDEKGQWLYFDRNLRIYEGHIIYLVKPLQRIHWLRSQALLDSDLILHDLVVQGA
jgi:hypothetical protein